VARLAEVPADQARADPAAAAGLVADLVADLVGAVDQVEAVVLAAAAAAAAAVLEAIRTRWAEGVVIKTTRNRLPS
jgi:hypothetical protein